VFQISIAPASRGFSVVEVEHAAEPLPSFDAADRTAGGEGDDVAQALAVALGVVAGCATTPQMRGKVRT
jgi:hypothetical protein